MRIGSFELTDRVFAAPMAGVTDRPFRKLCRRLGAAYAVSEMVASDPRMRASGKTSRRLDHDGEQAPIAVQLVGADPAILADREEKIHVFKPRQYFEVFADFEVTEAMLRHFITKVHGRRVRRG